MLLLCIVLNDQLVQVSDLLVQVLVDVLELSLGHLEYGLPLSVENLDFFLAEVELLSCLIYFLLKRKEINHMGPK